MKNLRTFLLRYRLITSALALAFMLAALTLSPPPASALVCNLGMICGQGCTNWNQANGCVECQTCCACGDDYQCSTKQDRVCEFTY
jgi:hypothetical protein